MLSNLRISIEAVAPMFIIMAIGVLIRKKGLLKPEDITRLNKTVFTVCFPMLMFTNLYGKNVKDAVNPKLMVFGVVAVLIITAITCVIVMKIEKRQKTRGAMIHAIYRSNFVIMGIPVVQNIFGADNLAMTSVMVTIIVPLYNVLAVIVLETFRGSKPGIGQILRGIIKNPLIIGAVAGIFAIAVNLKLPVFLESPINMLSSVATPMALLILGASFNIDSVAKEKKNLIICVLGRLVLVPAVGLTAGILLGFRDVALVTLIAIFASPTAVSSYTMAEQMNSDSELAGNAVIFSSMFACLTMFIWIFALKSMGMF